MAYILGIDVGTTTIVGLFYNSVSREIIKLVEINHKGFVNTEDPLKSEIDPQTLLSQIDILLKSFNNYQIDGISITGQMHSFIVLDKEQKPVTNFITWMDKRALNKSYSGKTYLEEFLSLHDCKPRNSMIGYMSPNLYAMKKSGELPENAQYFVTIHDFISNALCGKSVIDPSFAESTGFYENITKKWNDNLITKCGFSSAQFSQIQNTSELIGYYHNTPVFVGLGDNQASVLGSIANIDEMALINIGTGGQVSLVLTNETISPEIETRVFIGGKRLAVGVTLCSGKANEAMMKFIKKIGSVYFNVALEDKDIYALMENHNNVSTSLCCDPTFSGTRDNPDKSGSIYNINLSNFTIEDFLGALSKGIIEELHSLYKKINVDRNMLVVSGGLVKKSINFQNIIKMVFGKELLLTVCNQEAAMGAVIAAAKGLNIISSFNDLSDIIKYWQ